MVMFFLCESGQVVDGAARAPAVVPGGSLVLARGAPVLDAVDRQGSRQHSTRASRATAAPELMAPTPHLRETRARAATARTWALGAATAGAAGGGLRYGGCVGGRGRQGQGAVRGSARASAMPQLQAPRIMSRPSPPPWSGTGSRCAPEPPPPPPAGPTGARGGRSPEPRSAAAPAA